MPLLYGEGGQCFARLQEEVAKVVRPTAFQEFWVTPKRKSFFHVYVDHTSAKFQLQQPPAAWATHNNSALVAAEIGMVLSCEISIAGHMKYHLDFQETKIGDIDTRCEELEVDSVDSHTRESRTKIKASLKHNGNQLKAVVSASELKQMRRHTARVFTILVSFEEKGPDTGIDFCGKPQQNGEETSATPPPGKRWLRKGQPRFEKLKTPSRYWSNSQRSNGTVKQGFI